ncbi:lamin tail domain-containing protein [Streptomyces sp. NPDC057291]|uniref:lamin tail domain-containing protein n=1 Tax=Streptomyces sp. NPDC057291 TaxID=3346087 RepID=UPI003645C5AC
MSRSARRFTASVLAAGALVAAAALPAAADDHGHDRGRYTSYSPIVLGQIQYDSPGRDDGSNRSLNDEWVTVTNTSRQTVNLRGWTLTDESRRTYRFDLRLAGRSSVRVHTGIGRDNGYDVYQDLRRYVWDNRDTATLRDSRGYLVDSESWGRYGLGYGYGLGLGLGLGHDRDRGRDNRRDNGRDHNRDNGRDHNRDNGRDHDRDNGRDHDRDNGRDHDRDNGRDHDRDHNRGHDHDRGGRR